MLPGVKQVLKDAIASTGYEVRRYRPNSEGEVTHSNFNEQILLLAFVERLKTLTPYCVDLGAGDGITHSNSFGLYERGWSGAAIELNPERFARMAWRHRLYPNVQLVRTCITPPTIADLLSGLGVPHDFGILSLDLDGYDRFVLEAVLSRFQPGLLCLEINEKIPPPIKFTVLWQEDWFWREDHCYGQSLAEAHAFCSKANYRLAALEYNNAFFVRADLAEEQRLPELTPAQAFAQGYLSKPDRLTRLP